jgi:hypothetical protein
MDGSRRAVSVRGLRLPNLCDCWNDISGHANPVAGLVSRHLWLILSSLSVILSREPTPEYQGSATSVHLKP